MMTKSFLYVGDVSPLFKGRIYGGKVYDAYAQVIISIHNVFESQMMSGAKFKGNIQLKGCVFMPFPTGMGEKRRSEKDGSYFSTNPPLGMMLNSIESICRDLLFEQDAVIVAMNMEKRWSIDPRLEMIISEVGKNDRASKEE